DDAEPGGGAHRAAAQGVHGDHALQDPQRVDRIPTTDLGGDLLHGPAEVEEVAQRGPDGPVAVEQLVAVEGQGAGRGVAAHGEQRHGGRGELGVAEQPADLPADVGAAGVGEELPDPAGRQYDAALQDGVHAAVLDEVVGEARVAGVLDVGAEVLLVARVD